MMYVYLCMYIHIYKQLLQELAEQGRIAMTEDGNLVLVDPENGNVRHKNDNIVILHLFPNAAFHIRVCLCTGR